MKSSEEIEKLSASIVAAQAEIKSVSKDETATVGAYSYTYADLASVITSIRGVMAKHGLAFIQSVSCGDAMTLDTTVIHSSGQYLVSSVPLPGYGKAQELGSALTYARRYGLCAALGIATEDDDGKQSQDTPDRLEWWRRKYQAARTIDDLEALQVALDHDRQNLLPADYAKISGAIKAAAEKMKP